MYIPFISRHQSKILAVVLIGISILMLPDVIVPTPFMDMLINMPLAFVLADLLLISYLEAFVLTYIIAFLLLFAGLMVYPYNTRMLVAGRFHAALGFMVSHPIMVILSIIGLLLVYFVGEFLYTSMWTYAKELLAVAGVT